VDELLGNQEAMVKNIDRSYPGCPASSGQRSWVTARSANHQSDAICAAYRRGCRIEQGCHRQQVTSVPTIMVVDDSLTVRKITSRMLTRAGYHVVTATDGVDALEKLVDFTPDVMLLDIEMPRMDGFALARELRRDPKTHDMPIIMITSRTADKHREYAMQLGSIPILASLTRRMIVAEHRRFCGDT